MDLVAENYLCILSKQDFNKRFISEARVKEYLKENKNDSMNVMVEMKT